MKTRAASFSFVFILFVAACLGSPASARAAAGDEPPKIVEVQPQTGATEVPLTSPVVFTFNAPMAAGLTRVQFINVLSFPPAIVSMNTAWSTDGTQLVCTPVSPFSPMAQIQWHMTGQDVQGRALTGATVGAFFTGKLGGTTPKLLSSDPPSQARDVSQTATVAFTFNVPMNTLSTIARFWELTEDGTPVEVTSNWSGDTKVLTCSPVSSFAAGTIILWRLEGSDASGNIFPGAGGGFTTEGTRPVTNTPVVAIISRGESARQTEAELFERQGEQFLAFAQGSESTRVEVVTPSWKTNLLALPMKADIMEFSELIPDPTLFSSEYRPGQYRLFAFEPEEVIELPVPLDDSPLPSTPRFQAWRDPQYAVAGQPLRVSWVLPPEGENVKYFRLQVSRGGSVEFSTPLPGMPGVLTGQSNSVTIPAEVLTREGKAEVSLAAIVFISEGIDPSGVSVFSARHRMTTYEMQVVSDSKGPPKLVQTNFPALPMDEPLMIPLISTGGVPPIRYEVVGGQLAAGVQIAEWGAIEGVATEEGEYQATVQLTDLLGRTATQTLRIETLPLPPGCVQPQLQSPSLGADGLSLDLVDVAGRETIIECSENLVDWTPCFTNQPISKRTSVRLAANGKTAFVRARAPSIYPARLKPAPVTVQPTVNSNRNVSGEIGIWGGTLTLTNSSGFVFTLVIPQEALDGGERITMTEVSQIAGLPLSDGLIAAVDLQPEGLAFDRSVRLDITPPRALDVKTLLGFNAENAGTRFGLKPAFVTNNTVSLHLSHFSLAGLGGGTSQDTDGQMQNPPGNSADQLDQELANATAQCRGNPDCDVDSEEQRDEYRQILIRMADQVVIPALRRATADEEAALQAIPIWRQWLTRLQSLGLASLAGTTEAAQRRLAIRVRLAQILAGRSIDHAIRKNCDRCVKHEVNRLAQVITFAKWASLLGIGNGAGSLQCMQRCFRFQLKIESTFESFDGDRRFKTKTSAQVQLQPESTDSELGLLPLKGEAAWRIEDTDDASVRDCKFTAAPKNGQAKVPFMRLTLFRKTSKCTDAGELVTYSWNPKLLLAIAMNLDEMPKETRTETCPGKSRQDVEDLYSPAFLVFHFTEIETPSPGSAQEIALGGPVFAFREFASGQGEVFLEKTYEETRPVKNTDVSENTKIKLVHRPQ